MVYEVKCHDGEKVVAHGMVQAVAMAKELLGGYMNDDDYVRVFPDVRTKGASVAYVCDGTDGEHTDAHCTIRPLV